MHEIGSSLVNSLDVTHTRFVPMVVNHTASKRDKRRSSFMTIVRQLIQLLQILVELSKQSMHLIRANMYELVLIKCIFCSDKSRLVRVSSIVLESLLTDSSLAFSISV